MNKVLKIKKYNSRAAVQLKSRTSEGRALEPYTPLEYFQKRVVDYTLVTLLGVVTLPVVLYTIYRIKKESPGPIIFKQSRTGLYGKTFTCYKFRSMHVDGHFNPYTEENDSRIFPFGVVMRKMRIDELPQLINILRGEMHMIGPRAEWNILAEKYTKDIPHYNDRHLIRPGITGLAQVMYPYGRSVEDARRKLKYDLLYIKNWSLMLELKVILKTVTVILGQKGM